MTERFLDLKGLKCPLPAMKTRSALRQASAGDILTVECTDPLASIDIPNLVREMGDALQGQVRSERSVTFTIRKLGQGREAASCSGQESDG